MTRVTFRSTAAAMLPCLAMLVVAGRSAGASTTQGATVESVVRRAGEYVTAFVQEFADVIAEERYVQDVSGTSSPVAGTRHRELRSDLLLLKVGGLYEWRPFRDVFEVGGTPVRDRDERLATLFLKPSLLAIDRAQQIAIESARYNIGGVVRTVNTPVHALLFLQPSFQRGFEFTLGDRDRSAGEDVWVVSYREQQRPTLIRGDGDTDLPASGRFWIEAGTGRVLRSELVTYSGRVTARLTTFFKYDAQFGIAVPVEMREHYTVGRGQVTGVATYGHFRKFQVSAKSSAE
jgi:hypothetical protein